MERDVKKREQFNKEAKNHGILDFGQDNFYMGYEGIDELREEINKIKIMTVVIIIMDITRNLNEEQKKLLEKYCDQITLKKYHENEEHNKFLLESLLKQKNRNIDLLMVKKVSNMQFTEEEEKWLRDQFEKTKLHGFREYYQRLLKCAIDHERVHKGAGKNQSFLDSKTKFDAARKSTIDVHAARAKIAFDDAESSDEIEEFFQRLLEVFQKINFYNLLHWQAS